MIQSGDLVTVYDWVDVHDDNGEEVCLEPGEKILGIVVEYRKRKGIVYSSILICGEVMHVIDDFHHHTPCDGVVLLRKGE